MHQTSIHITATTTPDQVHAARLLFVEYADALGVDLCFQDYDTELAELPGEYCAPRGALLVAQVNGEPAGCCALRPLDSVDYANACEMKRLFVKPVYRGLGVGRQLVEHILELAKVCGYACVLLDTLDDMESARALYQGLGFVDIPPYYFNPVPGAHYLKAEL